MEGNMEVVSSVFVIIFMIAGVILMVILHHLQNKRIENSYLKVIVEEIKNGIGEKTYYCSGYQMYKNKNLGEVFSEEFNTFHDAVSYKHQKEKEYQEEILRNKKTVREITQDEELAGSI